MTFDTSLQVYSVADSLLVRRITLPVVGANNGAPYLVASALSQTSPNLVWLAASDGRIWRIDWTKGTGAQDCFRTKAGVIHDMTVGAVTLNKTLSDVLFVSESLKGTSKLVAYDPTDLSNPQSHVLQNDTGRVSIVRSAAGGLVLLAVAGNAMIIGALKQSSVQSLQNLHYDFSSVNAVDDICSLSIRHSPKKSLSKKKTSPELSDLAVDVAVGCVRGSIYVYSDLLSQLQNAPKRGLDAPRKQHWHRKAVHSVAWSKDGTLLFIY